MTYPDAIAFTLGPIDIYWYGLILALAIVVGFAITLNFVKKKQVNTDQMYNLLFWLILFGLIGGRIGHIIGEWEYYRSDPSELIKIWNGGLAIQGVITANLLTVYIYTKIKKMSFWKITDSIVVALPLMQAIGRWGNYFNQELFGKPTDVSWAIPINIVNRPIEYINYEYFHPVFLYESISMVLFFGIMLWLYKRNDFKLGFLTIFYFIGFSIIRFSIDFLKIDLLQIGPLLLSQWVSILFFVIAVSGLYYIKKQPHP